MDPKRLAAALLANDSRNQAPGMGSTANALPADNYLLAEKQALEELARSNLVHGGAGLVAATGLAASGFPPAYIPGVPALAYGLYNTGAGLLRSHDARKKSYQGN